MYHESFDLGIGVGLFYRFHVVDMESPVQLCGAVAPLRGDGVTPLGHELLHKEGNAITLEVTLSYGGSGFLTEG